MVPQAVLLLLTMAFIRIVGQIIVSRHNHLLINPLWEIGVNRLFNPHMHVPTPLLRPRQSIRRGAVPDNALPVYKVPQMAPLDRPITMLPITVLLVVHVVGMAHRHNSRRTLPRALLAETVVIPLPLLQLPVHRPRVPITATPLLPPRLLQSLALLSLVHRYCMHQRHVLHGLRHCHKAVQRQRSAYHVMTANCLNHSQMLLPFVAVDSKFDYAVSSPSTPPRQSPRRNLLMVRLRRLHRWPTELRNCKAMRQTRAILFPPPRNRRRKSAQHCSIPGLMHRRTIYPFLLQCRLLPWSFVS